MPSLYGRSFGERCVDCPLPRPESFCFLPKSSSAAFERIRVVNLLPKRSTLFSSGQDPIGVHVVCTGAVKLWTQNANGEVMIVKIAAGGEILGLHDCIVGKPYQFSAETVQPSHVAFAKLEDFVTLLRRDGGVCWKAAQVLCRHCLESHQLLRTFGRSASEKLARLLLDISACWQTNDNVARGSMYLTHAEMAEVIGVSRQTVWRSLCGFRAQGIAELQGSTLLIQNRQALKLLAAGKGTCNAAR